MFEVKNTLKQKKKKKKKKKNEEVHPDYHFYYNEINDCSYYTEDKFNTNMFEGNLSIIHFNIRSLYANLIKCRITFHHLINLLI